MLDDEAEPVVAAVTAAALHPHGPERKIQFIVNHDKIGWCCIEGPDDCSNGPAALVHIGLWFCQDGFFGTDPGPAKKRVMFVLRHLASQIPGKVVDCNESRI